ncbi:MAG: hypothetical protein IJW63_10985 [Lachnospiraceae bacterium]|nr:hypothetical protein [Lachnospiraceae bacterium]
MDGLPSVVFLSEMLGGGVSGAGMASDFWDGNFGTSQGETASIGKSISGISNLPDDGIKSRLFSSECFRRRTERIGFIAWRKAFIDKGNEKSM